MAKGIAAFVIIASLVFSMSILGGLGYYAEMGAGEFDVDGQNEDVQAAADNLDGIEFGEGRASSILEGPLAIVTPVVSGLQVVTTVLSNTSGILQLLYGVPTTAADTLETMFRLAMFVTIIFLVRGAVQ